MDRKDMNGRKLRMGESQRKDGRYMYRWTVEGKEKTVYALSLEELRAKEKSIKKDSSFSREISTLRKINNQSEVADFIDFFKEELPEVYKELYKEFRKRKEISK